MDVGSAAGLCHLFTHLFVQSRHNGLSRLVLDVVLCAIDGNGGTLRRTDAQHEHTHSLVLGLVGSLQCPTLVVLTVGNHDDGLADALFLREAVDGHPYGGGNVRTLHADHGRVDIAEEHLGRHVVARDRQLHEGIAGKDNQSHLVVGEMVHEVFHHHLGASQAARCYVLCHHGVGHVHGDDGLNARPLLTVNLSAHLRSCQHDNHQSQGGQQQGELDARTQARHIGSQRTHQPSIAKPLQAFLLPVGRPPPDGHHHGNPCEQIEIYGVFKSKHNTPAFLR